MQIHYSSRTPLSDDATERVHFDVDSIRQVLAAEGAPEPDVWVASPEGYQLNGHPLRDSESIRLIAYSRPARVVYATDGCNACRHALGAPVESMDRDGLVALSRRTELPVALLGHLAELLQ